MPDVQRIELTVRTAMRSAAPAKEAHRAGRSAPRASRAETASGAELRATRDRAGVRQRMTRSAARRSIRA